MCTVCCSCSHADHRSLQKITEVPSFFTFGRTMTLNWGFYFFEIKKKKRRALHVFPRDWTWVLRVLYAHLYFRKWDMVPGEVWGSLETPQQPTNQTRRGEQAALLVRRESGRGAEAEHCAWRRGALRGGMESWSRGRRLMGFGLISFLQWAQEEIWSIPACIWCRVTYITQQERNCLS